MALRDLFVRFKIDVSGQGKLAAADRAINKTKDSAKDLGDQLKTLGAAWAFVRSAGAVEGFIEGLINQGVELARNAAMLGITTDELQKYQYVAAAMHVPTQQAAVAMRFFNRSIGEASYGSKAANTTFARLGMSIYDQYGQIRPTSELLFEFADKVKKVGNVSQQTALAARLLGRGGAQLLPMFQAGSEGLKEMFKDVEELGGAFDKEFIDKANEVKRQQMRLVMGWKTMSSELGKALFPMLGRLIERSIKNIKVWIDYAKHTNMMQTGIYALVIALGALATAWTVLNISMAPVLLLFTGIALAVGLIYLAFDDLFSFLNGDDSVIGEILDKLGGEGHAKEVLDSLVKAFNDIKDALGLGNESAGQLGEKLAIMFAKSIPGMVAWGGTFAALVIDGLSRAADKVEKLDLLFQGVFGNMSFKEMNAKLDAINTRADKLTDKLQAGVRALDSLETPTTRSPTLGTKLEAEGGTGTRVPGTTEINGKRVPDREGDQSSNTANDNRSSVTANVTNNITINGPADPRKVQDAADKGTQSGLDKSLSTRNRDAYSAATTGMPTYSSVGEATSH